MGLFDTLFGSETETESSSTQVLEPWGPAAGGLQNIANRATSLAGTPLEFYPGQTFVGQTPEQMDILRGMYDTAGGFGGSILDPAMQAYSTMTDPSYWQNASDMYAENVGRNFRENILPSIQDSFTDTGGRRSSRRALSEQAASERALGDIARYQGQMDLGYQTMAQRDRLNAIQNAPGMMDMMLQPGRLQYGLQDDMTLDDRRALEEDMARHYYGQEQGAWGNLQNAYSILGPMAQAFGTSRGEATQTTTSTPPLFNTIAGGIGTVMGLGMGMPGMGGGMGMAYNPGLSTALNPSGYYVPPNLMMGPYPGSYGR